MGAGADSLFGKALSSLGMTLKRIGEAHANADMSVMDRAILPLKNLLDTTMKQVSELPEEDRGRKTYSKHR